MLNEDLHVAISKYDIEGTFLILNNGTEVKINNNYFKSSILTYTVKNVSITYDKIYKKYKFVANQFQPKLITEDFKNLRIKKIIYKKLLKQFILKRKENSYEHS